MQCGVCPAGQRIAALAFSPTQQPALLKAMSDELYYLALYPEVIRLEGLRILRQYAKQQSCGP